MEAIIVLVAFLLLVLFIFAANIMSLGGITKRIFLFCDAICGHFSGGLAHANVLASMLFGGISGASNADAVGLGAIEIEMMTEKGYKRSYSAAVTAASAILSSIVPPSNIFIVYAVTAGTVSVSAMFIGGIVPAVLLTALLIGLNVYYAKRYNFPRMRSPLAGAMWAKRRCRLCHPCSCPSSFWAASWAACSRPPSPPWWRVSTRW